MPYFVVEDFKAGVDVTRPAFAGGPGTLQECVNAHVTRGGDLEKRKAFVAKYALPGGTFGFASVSGSLYVFGSAAPPTMPVGVSYVRLQNGGKVMSNVLMADAFNGKLYVVVEWTDGTISHFYDGALVAAWYDGRSRGQITVTGGENFRPGTPEVPGDPGDPTAEPPIPPTDPIPAKPPVYDQVTSIRVNGVEILGAAVTWAGSNSDTAAAIAAQIDAYASDPEYTATAVGPSVFIEAAASAGATPNGFAITTAVTNLMEISVVSAMSGGQAAGTTFTPGASIRTFKQKLYSTSGSNLHACAINDPHDWNTTDSGSWFVNLGSFASGAQQLVTTGTYYDQLAIFSNVTTLLWDVQADPADNKQLQELASVGVVGRKGVGGFRDGTLVFLSDQGVKALRARDASNLAIVQDVSLPIDPLLLPRLRAAPQPQRDGVIVVTEPEDGRMWVVLGTSVYVLSAFGSIHAWSEYQPGFVISDIAIASRRLYARSGNTIYLYGGDDGATYDASPVSIVLPYVTMRAPATFKNLRGLDIGAEGFWDIYLRQEADSADEEPVATGYSGLSYDRPAIPVAAHATHISLRLSTAAAGYARLCGVALHYEFDEAL